MQRKYIVFADKKRGFGNTIQHIPCVVYGTKAPAVERAKQMKAKQPTTNYYIRQYVTQEGDVVDVKTINI
jgi:hypothetical protein